MSLIKRLLTFISRKSKKTSVCGVKGCKNTDRVEMITLLPLDPIDHDESFVALCPRHQEWADERNEFAKEMKAELVDARKEIGQEHMSQIRELSMPQSGKLREDILMGNPEEEHVGLEEAFDETPPELGQPKLPGDRE